MKQPIDIAVRYALQLSLMEVSLGSLLHTLHVPCSGFFLSLNQCYVLNRALLSQDSTTPYLPIAISNTAAVVKSLSPYGKKCTPMLAISMQGLLFNLGSLVFGQNLLGRCVGSLLLALWPMLQPLLIYGVIYSSLFEQLKGMIPLQALLIGYVSLHLFLSLAVAFIASFMPANLLERYDNYALSQSRPVKKLPAPVTDSGFKHTLKGVWKDFTAPFFLLSVGMSALFLYTTLHSLEAFVFVFLRLIAVSLLTFFLVRKLSIAWVASMLNTCSLSTYTPYVEEVLRRMQNPPKSW